MSTIPFEYPESPRRRLDPTRAGHAHVGPGRSDRFDARLASAGRASATAPSPSAPSPSAPRCSRGVGFRVSRAALRRRQSSRIGRTANPSTGITALSVRGKDLRARAAAEHMRECGGRASASTGRTVSTAGGSVFAPRRRRAICKNKWHEHMHARQIEHNCRSCEELRKNGMCEHSSC